MCEVLLPDMTPHPSNTRAACAAAAEKYADFDTWFGIEQEYTFFDGTKPLGWPFQRLSSAAGRVLLRSGIGRGLWPSRGRSPLGTPVLRAGLMIAGINGEVMPAQWEFQIGPVGAPEVADQLWIARWLLYRIGEDIHIGEGRQRRQCNTRPQTRPG